MNRARARAAVAWRPSPPDWVLALARHCDATSQSRVGRDLGLSASTINQVLGRCYPGDVARIEAAVRARLLNAAVVCPQLGDMALEVCLDWQAKAKSYAASGALRQRMRRACPRCSHWKGRKHDA